MTFTILDYIICSFQLISFIVYILVIIFLIKLICYDNCGTSTEFYFHFIANGIVDILSNILDILIRRLLTWGLFYEFFESYLWIGNLSPIIYYSTVANCAIGIVVITFNRFMQINFPIRYKIFWTKKITFFMILFQLVAPYLSYLYLLNYKVTLLYSEEKNYYYHSMKDKTASWNNSFIMCIWSGITFILTLFMNICNVKKYIQFIRKKKNLGLSSSKIYLYSMYSFLISISLLLVFINSCMKLYAVTFNLKILKEIASSNYEWIILLMTCCHPFLLLILSKKMRTELLIFYRLYQCFSNVVVPIHVNEKTKTANRAIIR